MRQVASGKSISIFNRTARGLRRHTRPNFHTVYHKVSPRRITIDALQARGWLNRTRSSCSDSTIATQKYTYFSVFKSAREYCICTPNHRSTGRYSTEDKSLLITTSLPHVATPRSPRFDPLRNRQPRIPRVRTQISYFLYHTST